MTVSSDQPLCIRVTSWRIAVRKPVNVSFNSIHSIETKTLPFGLKNPVIQKHFGRPIRTKMIHPDRALLLSTDHNLANYYIEYIDQVIPKTKSQVYCFPMKILSNRLVLGHRKSSQECASETKAQFLSIHIHSNPSTYIIQYNNSIDS